MMYCNCPPIDYCHDETGKAVPVIWKAGKAHKDGKQVRLRDSGAARPYPAPSCLTRSQGQQRHNQGQY